MIDIKRVFLSLLVPAIAWIANPSAVAGADTRSEVDAHLARFMKDPLSVMKGPVERWDAQGVPVPEGADLRFTSSAIATGAALRARNQLRARAAPRSPVQGNDRAEDLVDGHNPLRTLESLEAHGLRSARLSQSPWSDDYWGAYKGVIADRYADSGFPGGEDWQTDHQYILRNPADAIIQSGQAGRINVLSPSEKYELLVGDTSGNLTAAMWNMGPQYADGSGQVDDWIGICQGWAAAAFMLPRPSTTVTLTAADGQTPVTFYPSDIKGLASLIWAQAAPPIRFVGGRCDTVNPRTDANGRIQDQDCFDTNLGTWHVVVTNQLGRAHRGFVLDAAYDYEVWNQPAYSYSYGYFNPETGKSVGSLSQARVRLDAFDQDKFRGYRSQRTVSVVGVVMDLTYVSETRPSHATTDSAASDIRRTVRYYYDLELDGSGEIVGGEWYNNRHPDFLWVPEPGAEARSVAEDDAYGDWNGSGAMPASWQAAAARADASAQPLGKIVERLMDWTESR